MSEQTNMNKYRKQMISAPGAAMAVYEDEGLYLTIANAYLLANERPKLVEVVPVDIEGNAVEYSCRIDGVEMALACGGGEIRMHMTKDDILRVTGKNIGVRFYFKPSESMLECCCNVEDGACEAMMFLTGKLLFVPINGDLKNTAVWDPVKACSEDYYVEMMPKGTEASWNLAVHQYYKTGKALEHYAFYEESLGYVNQQFVEFCEKHMDALAEIDICRNIWFNLLNVGFHKDVLGYVGDKTENICAYGWEQGLLASKLTRDPQLALSMILNYMRHMSETGAVPAGLAPILEHTAYAATPVFGYAVLKLLASKDAETCCLKADLEELRVLLEKNLRWWIHRWDEEACVPAYFHWKEGGNPAQALGRDVMPVITPDLVAWLMLQAQACIELDKALGKDVDKALGKDICGDGCEDAAGARSVFCEEIKEILSEQLKDLQKEGEYVGKSLTTGAFFEISDAWKWVLDLV